LDSRAGSSVPEGNMRIMPPGRLRRANGKCIHYRGYTRGIQGAYKGYTGGKALASGLIGRGLRGAQQELPAAKGLVLRGLRELEIGPAACWIGEESIRRLGRRKFSWPYWSGSVRTRRVGRPALHLVILVKGDDQMVELPAAHGIEGNKGLGAVGIGP
jgi:hypothetical protein